MTRSAIHAAAPALLLAACALTPAPAGAVPGEENHEGLAIEWMYPTARLCARVALGDLDADGDPDLALVDGAADSLSLWWNDGRGRFGRRSTIRVGPRGPAIAILDADGDGLPDIALGRAGGVTLLRNLGGGAFAAPVATAAGLPTSQRLVVADMNGDGLPDLVGASQLEDRSVGIALNSGGAGFVTRATAGLEGGARALVVADLDGDGRLDVATGATRPDAPRGVSLLRGDGAGGLAWIAGFERPFIERSTDLAALDFDGDGDRDLVSADDGGVIGFHTNLGPWTFAGTLGPHTATEYGSGLALARLDDDAEPELVVATSHFRLGARFRVYRGGELPGPESGELYSYAHYHQWERSPDQVVSGDLDGDGRDDLVFLTTCACAAPPSSVCPAESRVGIVRTRHDGRPGAMALHPLVAADQVAVARFRPGSPEIVLAGGGLVQRTRLGERGVPVAPRRIAEGRGAWPLDADGDGRDDLVIAVGAESLELRLSGRDGELGPAVARWAGAVLASGDLGGHPGEDLVCADPGGDVMVRWSHPAHPYRRTTPTGLVAGQSRFVVGRFGPGPGAALARVARTRFDLIPPDVRVDTACVYRLNAGGRFEEASRSPLEPGMPAELHFTELVASDLDREPGDELVLLHLIGNSGGYLSVARNRGARGFEVTEAPRRLASEDPHDLLAADLDADGDQDLAWAVQNSGLIYRFEVLWNDGSGGLEEHWVRHVAGSVVAAAAFGDLDGDGAGDLVFVTREYPSGGGVPAGIGTVFGERSPAIRTARPGRAARPSGIDARNPGARILSLGPNPVRDVLSVELELGPGPPARLELYDLQGRLVHGLNVSLGADGRATHSLRPDPRLPPGVYWIALRRGARTDARRVTLLR